MDLLCLRISYGPKLKFPYAWLLAVYSHSIGTPLSVTLLAQLSVMSSLFFAKKKHHFDQAPTHPTLRLA